MSQQQRTPSKALRALPSVDALLRTETARGLRASVGAEHLTRLARAVTEDMRRGFQTETEAAEASNGELSRDMLIAEAARRLEKACRREASTRLQRVINATGVIVHTNLGRAPLAEDARRAIVDEAGGYCTLEYDLETGERGRRGARVEQLLVDLTGAEASLVVNNCAAAALLILTVLAQGGETIVSRGELVEIGGDFRVPDVMTQSGTRLIEVGATNRTRLSDYRRAITENTRLVMRVHPSNFRIIGFTATPTLSELVDMAHEAGQPLYEDAGSGVLLDLTRYGLDGEPVIRESVKAGADLVSFSGDKLLGSVQAGLIVGRRDLVRRLIKHPLYRALRADKLALAALEATLDIYRAGNPIEDIPTLRMLSATTEEIENRAQSFVSRLEAYSPTLSLRAEIIEGESAIGGGSAPMTHPPTALIALQHRALSAQALDKALRHSKPPVIARITGDRVLLDLRTVHPDQEAPLFTALTTFEA